MKAIVEYRVVFPTTGLLAIYPKTIKKVNYKYQILKELKGYTKQKKNSYTQWDRYDEFLENSLLDVDSNINIIKLYKVKNKYIDMQKNSKFYTNEDFKSILDDINRLYQMVIKEVEISTNRKYGIDFVLE